MNRIKTLIIDDEKPARRALRGLLAKDPEIEVVGEAMDGEEALELIRALQPQLLFLDVQMPMMTGLEMIERLPATARPAVVFVTAYDQHALTAFNHHAVDYLVKPFSDSRFDAAVERAKQRLRSGALAATEQTLRTLLAHLQQNGGVGAPVTPVNEHARIVVKADGQLHFINQRDIRWVEGQGDFAKIHLKDNHRLLVRMTMTRFESSLDPAQFVRIHKSTIVNLASVRRVVPMMARSRGMELDDGAQLPIGPSYRSVLDRLK
ncbi:LytR/AlgR family response regulator transcription factor [Oleiharenicola lentus]|uniref:LytR/AlgR family response regulator transcription factor n=1 Tax=Oleiharenicola lentus TaxID=2508720 RepID=UPI003F6647E8